MPKARFTVRRAMLTVAVTALVTLLSAPAIRILSDPRRRTLTHLWQRPDGSYLFSSHPVGFWARYRQSLLGVPWDCPPEMCEENRRLCREIDSGKSADAMLRDHPTVLKAITPPR
jgi:hypothetical protein